MQEWDKYSHREVLSNGQPPQNYSFPLNVHCPIQRRNILDNCSNSIPWQMPQWIQNWLPRQILQKLLVICTLLFELSSDLQSLISARSALSWANHFNILYTSYWPASHWAGAVNSHLTHSVAANRALTVYGRSDSFIKTEKHEEYISGKLTIGVKKRWSKIRHHFLFSFPSFPQPKLLPASKSYTSLQVKHSTPCKIIPLEERTDNSIVRQGR